jgi:hypothetical protein
MSMRMYDLLNTGKEIAEKENHPVLKRDPYVRKPKPRIMVSNFLHDSRIRHEVIGFGFKLIKWVRVI